MQNESDLRAQLWQAMQRPGGVHQVLAVLATMFGELAADAREIHQSQHKAQTWTYLKRRLQEAERKAMKLALAEYRAL